VRSYVRKASERFQRKNQSLQKASRGMNVREKTEDKGVMTRIEKKEGVSEGRGGTLGALLSTTKSFVEGRTQTSSLLYEGIILKNDLGGNSLKKQRITQKEKSEGWGPRTSLTTNREVASERNSKGNAAKSNQKKEGVRNQMP